LPLADAGCIAKLDLFTGDAPIVGTDHDLSAFGCDFSRFQELKCQVKDQMLSVFLNGKTVFTAPERKSLGRIVGTKIFFEGAGQVQHVRLSSGKIAYTLLKWFQPGQIFFAEHRLDEHNAMSIRYSLTAGKRSWHARPVWLPKTLMCISLDQAMRPSMLPQRWVPACMVLRHWIITALRKSAVKNSEAPQSVNCNTKLSLWYKTIWKLPAENLAKNKAYSAIKIGGLSIGLVVAILIGYGWTTNYILISSIKIIPASGRFGR
jgi:hypothetical protein